MKGKRQSPRTLLIPSYTLGLELGLAETLSLVLSWRASILALYRQ